MSTQLVQEEVHQRQATRSAQVFIHPSSYLEVHQAAEHVVLGDRVMRGQEDLALEHELEVAPLPGLLHDDVTHVVFVAQRARVPTGTRTHGRTHTHIYRRRRRS